MATNEATDPYEVISRTLIQENLLEALAAVEEYWTEDRLLEAQPIGREAEPGLALEALFEEAFEPEGDAELNRSEPGAAQVAELDLDNIAAGSFRTDRVPDRTVFPYAVVGKLFMTFDGQNYVGSAWVTADSGIFTAGHCVFDEGAEDGWADRVLFIPQYHQGAEPLGRWAVTTLHTLAGWAAGGEDKYKYDMAAGRVDRPIGGQTGVMGWMANYPPDQGPYQAIGYPARYLSPAYPFDGQEMWRSSGGYLGGQNPIKMANNMTQGCSGGPRLTLRDGEIYANGLNSFRWSNEPDTMYSPYFGRGFLNLLNAI
jgi:V8-like Glu-specific endopeptidase